MRPFTVKGITKLAISDLTWLTKFFLAQFDNLAQSAQQGLASLSAAQKAAKLCDGRPLVSFYLSMNLSFYKILIKTIN